MPRVRPALALAAGLALLAAEAARSQPSGVRRAPAPTPLAVLVLLGIDDPAVVADLKLTPEQLKTLVARRQAGWDETYTAAPTAEATAARIAATDAALKATLSPAQYKRAAQLGAQRVLLTGFSPPPGRGVPATKSIRFTASAVATYPELADAIRLTDEQKKTLAAPAPGFGGASGFQPPLFLGRDEPAVPAGGFGALPLTADQQKAATEFMGPVLAAGWTAKTDPRVAAIPSSPRALALLAAKDVRADVGVTDEQGKAVAETAERWTKLQRERFSTLSLKDYAAAATGLAAETEKLLAATLTPTQAARLKQIDRQTQPGRGLQASGTHVEELYKAAESVREFGITPEQVAALDGVWAAFRADAAKALLSGEPAAAEKRLADLAAARRAKAEAVLTTAQAATVKDAFGAPFTGSTRDRTSGATGAKTADLGTIRAAAFGRYTTELNRLALDAAVQAELKLTPEQVKKAEEAAAAVQTKATPPWVGAGAEGFAKTMAERSALVEAELGKLLTPAQGKRFREIMMQARERNAITKGASMLPSAVSYPGAAEAVGLTADQRTALIAGTDAAEVLTAPQKETLAKLMGEPFGAARAAQAARPRPSRLVIALAQPGGPVERELALTPEQTTALAEARKTYQAVVAASRPGFGAGTNLSARETALADAGAAFEKSLATFLTPAQTKRLPQISRQIAAAADLVAALTAPDAAELALTDDQKARLAAVAGEAVRLQRLVTTHSADTPDQALAFRLRDAADERMLAVLTADQRAKWAGLTGPPVAGLRKTIPGRFVFGPRTEVGTGEVAMP
ncbi:hypothetical protein [Urbifossiella limnaea]|uniref:LTXXQ motif protein n=1 Tax=Urbifossiella limnaea TaxID=2528023 RepID=A0A517Y1B1_9BACT|nr:hypothetical protein [Urbifossiella limnaea]QDU23534.1 LTXXQ motif protein [Urbifossiella limnaea]